MLTRGRFQKHKIHTEIFGVTDCRHGQSHVNWNVSHTHSAVFLVDSTFFYLSNPIFGTTIGYGRTSIECFEKDPRRDPRNRYMAIDITFLHQNQLESSKILKIR